MKINKLWGGLFDKAIDKQVSDFLSGRDVDTIPAADYILLPYDLMASKAHVKMLYKVKLIYKVDSEKLLEGLNEIENLYQKGKFKLNPNSEDMHTNIESFLINKYGIEIGGKIHTARSRNDQIIVATRLFLRDYVNKFIEATQDLVDELNNSSKKYEDYVMPGYTHHQKAMPTNFSEILLCFKAMFIRDKEKFESWLKIWNKNPLGVMAGYGTTLSIDRKYTSKLLGFNGVEENSIDTVTSRWEPEADFVYTVCSLMTHLSILAQTFILFSSEHIGYLTISDEFCTGSSVMPQKKNPDTLEVIKGKASWILGQLVSLISIAKGNLVGYNRDTQWTKYIIVDVVRECLPAPIIITSLVEKLKVNKEKMREATKTGNLYATNYVEKLIKEGLPMRQAKMKVEKMIKKGNKF